MEEVWWNLRTALGVLGRPEVPVLAGAPAETFAPHLGWARRQRADRLVPFVGAYEKADRPRVPPGGRPPSPAAAGAAAEFITAAATTRGGGPLDLLCIGPLTNLSHALRRMPALASAVRQAYVMGGYFGPGSHDGHRPDFNFWFDPAAADHVLNSGIKVVLVPLEVCRTAAASDSLTETLGAAPAGVASVFVDDFLGMVEQHGPSMALCDQLVALLHQYPGLATSCERGRVSVECDRTAGGGRSRFRVDPRGTVTLVRAVDVRRVHALLAERVRQMAAGPARAESDPRRGPMHYFRTPRYEYYAEERLRAAEVAVAELVAQGGRVSAPAERRVAAAAELLDLIRVCAGSRREGAPVRPPPQGVDPGEGTSFLAGKRYERAVYEWGASVDVFALCCDERAQRLGVATGSFARPPAMTLFCDLPGPTTGGVQLVGEARAVTGVGHGLVSNGLASAVDRYLARRGHAPHTITTDTTQA